MNDIMLHCNTPYIDPYNSEHILNYSGSDSMTTRQNREMLYVKEWLHSDLGCVSTQLFALNSIENICFAYEFYIGVSDIRNIYYGMYKWILVWNIRRIFMNSWRLKWFLNYLYGVHLKYQAKVWFEIIFTIHYWVSRHVQHYGYFLGN